MKTINIQNKIRKDLVSLKGYSSARSEFTGEGSVFLDANENPFKSKYNRYPDPLQIKLKQIIAEKYELSQNSIFLSNGSDELIDLLMRGFCEPKIDSVLSIAPSYGMYAVSAALNQLNYQEVTLNPDFSLPIDEIIEKSQSVKLLFICSPNNPTGNAFLVEDIKKILEKVEAFVVIDEAYIEFSKEKSVRFLLEDYQNLIVSQTFSKAFGLAGIRLGKAFANPEIVSFLNKIKPPYNISSSSQEIALEYLQNEEKIDKEIAEICKERSKVFDKLEKMKGIIQVFPSDANFILFRVENAQNIYEKLLDKGIVTRNRSSQILCENTLRVTIGTSLENDIFLTELNNILN
jgi:histidinol-phosphate aminotransferase